MFYCFFNSNFTSTFRLTWNEKNLNNIPPCLFSGWTIEVCGSSSDLECMLRCNFVWAGSAAYCRNLARLESGQTKSMVGVEKNVWILSPVEQPKFSKDNGARKERRPMEYVSCIFSELGKLGYQVVGYGSDVLENDVTHHQTITSIWTLSTKCLCEHSQPKPKKNN